MKFGRIFTLAWACAAAWGSEPARPTHWSLQPVTRPALPRAPGNFPPARNPVDLFIWQKLDGAGLSPSPEAPAGVLARRAHFLLTGLPPEDGAGRAPYEAMVQRLLDSPRYGERWARHWLDVVRFAETHGFEMNQPRGSAWRYRDYVIRAFNRDKPYDRFIREQLAGDVFGAGDATGFLVGGPWDQVKSPDPVLTANQRADELHDMVNTTGTTFLGLTIGCARCHDHKFDPIPQTDYYAIKAVFAGVEHGERQRGDPEAARLRGEAQEMRERTRGIDTALEALEPLADPDSTNATRMAVNARRNVERLQPLRARAVRFTIRKTTGAEPCLDELEVYSTGGTNVALASLGAVASASGTYPNAEIHKLDHINDGQVGNSHSWISNEEGKGWVRIEFPAETEIDRIVWGRDREGKFADRLAVEYTIEARTDGGEWGPIASSGDRQKPGGEARPVSEEAARLMAERKDLNGQIGAIEKNLLVYAGVFQPSPKEIHRLHRGDPMLERETIPPGALSAIAGDRWEEKTAPGWTEDQARRAALANWIASRDNPLTARVMVNRIWQYHFGQGLVGTSSDFGANGARPTHPELLDWLASEFMDSGWSIKHIQRLIVTSATFRQASAARPEGLARDAGARLLWRFPSRRLEAEAIRDSILRASGHLDDRMGGPGFSFFETNEN